MHMDCYIIAYLPSGGWYGVVAGERQAESSRTVGRAASRCMPHYQASRDLVDRDGVPVFPTYNV